MKKLQNLDEYDGPGRLLYNPDVGCFPYKSVTAISLKDRLQYARQGILTDTRAIHEIVFQFPLIPFTDFMIGYTEEYLSVMKELHHGCFDDETYFDDITLGEVLECIVHRQETVRSGQDQKTVNSLIQAVSAPFMPIIFKDYKSIFVATQPLPVLPYSGRKELLENSPYAYIDAPKETPAATCEPLDKRLEHIYQSKTYIIKNAYRTGHLESLDLTFQLLSSISLADYYTCINEASCLLSSASSSEDSENLSASRELHCRQLSFWQKYDTTTSASEKVVCHATDASSSIASNYSKLGDNCFMHDIFHLIFYPMACISMCYNMSVDEVDAYLFWYPEDDDDDYEENNEEETCDNEDKETGANAEKNEKERKKHYASKYF